jgi:hypothetical protein
MFYRGCLGLLFFISFCPASCSEYTDEKLVIFNSEYDDTKTQFYTPGERKDDPRAGEPEYIYLVESCEGVMVPGPSLAGSEIDQLFVLDGASIAEQAGEPNQVYRVSVNSRLAYNVLIEDYEGEIALSRVELTKSEDDIDSTFYFAAVGDGVAHDAMACVVLDGEKGDSSDPVTIESRAGICEDITGGKTFLGVFASPTIEDGVINLRVNDDSEAVVSMAFTNLPSVSLTGSFDSKGVLDVDDQGYRLQGQMLDDTSLTGTYSGPNGSPYENTGAFVLFDSSQYEVAVYCGTYEGTFSGVWNLVVLGDERMSGIANDARYDFAAVLIEEGFDGTSFQLRVAGTSEDWIGVGTRDGQAASGTWTSGPALVGSGNFSALIDGCPSF